MRTRTGRPSGPLRAVASAVALAAALALAVGCSTASSSSSPPGLLSASMGGNPVTLVGTRATAAAGTVLTDGTGYTLYWFSQDSASSSACDTTCVPQWPPVTGAPKTAAGAVLPGRFGVITRADGVVQATYDGHPLYTFAGDFDPGDVSGNGVEQFGGTWHAVHPAP